MKVICSEGNISFSIKAKSLGYNMALKSYTKKNKIYASHPNAGLTRNHI